MRILDTMEIIHGRIEGIPENGSIKMTSIVAERAAAAQEDNEKRLIKEICYVTGEQPKSAEVMACLRTIRKMQHMKHQERRLAPNKHVRPNTSFINLFFFTCAAIRSLKRWHLSAHCVGVVATANCDVPRDSLAVHRP